MTLRQALYKAKERNCLVVLKGLDDHLAEIWGGPGTFLSKHPEMARDTPIAAYVDGRWYQHRGGEWVPLSDPYDPETWGPSCVSAENKSRLDDEGYGARVIRNEKIPTQ